MSSDKYNSMLFDTLFVEEHITIYNRHASTEKYHVALQLMDKSPRAITNAPAAKHSHQFLSLEWTITEFLQQYTELWHQILERRPEVAHSLCDSTSTLPDGSLENISHAEFQRLPRRASQVSHEGNYGT